MVFLNASSQVCYPTADASPYAGPCSGKGDRGEGAGGGNQWAVLRRQVLCQNPSRSTSQIYEIELEFFFFFYMCPTTYWSAVLSLMNVHVFVFFSEIPVCSSSSVLINLTFYYLCWLKDTFWIKKEKLSHLYFIVFGLDFYWCLLHYRHNLTWQRMDKTEVTALRKSNI